MTWHEARLGDVLTLKRGHDLPESQRDAGEVPVVSSSGITGYHSVAKAKAPGVVTGRYGTLGEVYFLDEDYWPLNTALYVTDFKGNDPRFVAYFLRSVLRNYQSDKSAVPGVNRNVLHALPVSVPELSTQRRIASVLAAYDDLIGNNRRRMTLLEDAAQQIYREWFTRLRFPAREHTRLVDGLPAGWVRCTIGDVCEGVEDGDWIETKDQGGDEYRLLQVSNVGVSKFIETGNFRYISAETYGRLNCREVTPGQILVSRMPRPIGRAWRVTEMPWRMITSVDVAILTPNEALADSYFLTYVLNSPETLGLCEKRAGGATRPRIAKRDLVSLPFVLPAPHLRRAFSDAVKPINEMCALLYRENRALIRARDVLSPRLMRGEIAA